MAKPTWDMTKVQLAALDYIGSHRKTGTYPHRKSCPVSVRTANFLVKIKFAMWNGKQLILTYEGEKRWSERHPHSKYAVKYPRKY